MALVTKVDWVPKDRIRLHSETTCHACSYDSPTGEKILQLDTHGSSTRQIIGKVSQTLQFDEAGAKQLLVVVKRAFPQLF
jgi:hypothetical protein